MTQDIPAIAASGGHHHRGDRRFTDSNLRAFVQQLGGERHLEGVHEMSGSIPIVDPPLVETGDFSEFYRSRYQRAFRLAWLLTSGGSDCDDLVQDAFLRIERHWAGLTNPTAYLRTTIVNLCREMHRRHARESARDRLAQASKLAATSAHDSHLLDLVARLPHAQRAVLVLRYWADLTDVEIASILDVRRGTVRSLAHRANRQLHKELSHDD